MRLPCLPLPDWLLRALASLVEHAPSINNSGNWLRNRRHLTVRCARRGKWTDQAQNRPSRSEKKLEEDSRPHRNNCTSIRISGNGFDPASPISSLAQKCRRGYVPEVLTWKKSPAGGWRTCFSLLLSFSLVQSAAKRKAKRQPQPPRRLLRPRRPRPFERPRWPRRHRLRGQLHRRW